MWAGQLPVHGSNEALTNTLQSLQNSKIKNPEPSSPLRWTQKMIKIFYFSPIKPSKNFKLVSRACYLLSRKFFSDSELGLRALRLLWLAKEKHRRGILAKNVVRVYSKTPLLIVWHPSIVLCLISFYLKWNDQWSSHTIVVYCLCSCYACALACRLIVWKKGPAFFSTGHRLLFCCAAAAIDAWSFATAHNHGLLRISGHLGAPWAALMVTMFRPRHWNAVLIMAKGLTPIKGGTITIFICCMQVFSAAHWGAACPATNVSWHHEPVRWLSLGLGGR